MPEFRTYQAFPTTEAARGLLRLLQQHHIPFDTVYERPDTPEAGLPAKTAGQLQIRLHPADFDVVRDLEAEASQQRHESVDPHHYLLTCSPDELLDVLTKPSAWNPADVDLARQLLRERGYDISTGVVNRLRRTRPHHVARAGRNHVAWLVAGYLMVLLGGLPAIFIGWHLYSHQHYLPDGSARPAFTPTDRQHGRNLLVLGFFGAVVWVALGIYIGF